MIGASLRGERGFEKAQLYFDCINKPLPQELHLDGVHELEAASGPGRNIAEKPANQVPGKEKPADQDQARELLHLNGMC